MKLPVVLVDAKTNAIEFEVLAEFVFRHDAPVGDTFLVEKITMGPVAKSGMKCALVKINNWPPFGPEMARCFVEKGGTLTLHSK